MYYKNILNIGFSPLAMRAPYLNVLIFSVATLPLAAGAAPPLGSQRSTPLDGGATEAAPVSVGYPAAAGPLQPQAEPVPQDPEQPNPPAENPDQTSQDPPIECLPGSVYVGYDLCVTPDIKEQIDAGVITVNPDGSVVYNGPPVWDPNTGQFGSYNAATQPCDPNIEVKLKQAALAGSQVTRAISDRQMGYPQVDPIEAVNNPQRDCYGGVCTIDLFALDLGRLLGTAYEQVRNLIETLSKLSLDSLFGAACQVINTIFGDMQSQLLQDLANSSPLTNFQQFVNQIRIGYISPLQSFIGYGLTVRDTRATVPGVTSRNPLQVSYIPGKGYVYLADLGGGNVLVVNVSQTPLVPEDTVAPPSAR